MSPIRVPQCKVNSTRFHSPHIIRQVVGHEQPKSDVKLRTYFRGELEQAKVACVKAVVMPESVRKLLPVSSGQLAAPAAGELQEVVE